MRHRVEARLSWNLRAVLYLALLSLVVLPVALVPAVQAQEPQDEAIVERVARGRIAFRLYCRSCHGDRATGNGPVAEMLKVPPADLTRLSAENGGKFPAEKVHRMIDGRDLVKGHGDRDMPVWGVAFRVVEESEDEAMVKTKIDRLVQYLESIQVE